MAATIFPVLDHRQTSLSGFAREPVSLSGLKASNVLIEWHEAVAIIQELCRGLIDSKTELEANDLNLDNVRIDIAGNVIAPTEIQDGPSAVRQAGELLRSVLPDDFPVPLRLALSQSSSTPPFYASLKSFSQALEYFERPNRPAIIQGVYRRWDERVLEKAKPEKSIPEPEREPKASAPRGASRALPRQFVLMAAVGGVLLAIVAALLLTLRVETPRAGSSADSARSLGARAVETAGSVANAVIDRIGVPAKPLVPDVARPTVPPVSEPVPIAAPTRSRPAPLQSITPMVQIPVRETEIAREPDTTVHVVELVPQEPAVAAQQPSASIYSAENTDVSPPVAVYSQFPSPIEPRPRDASIFDIVIDRAGNVESVRARRPPTSMADAMVLTMSLSAAKTWRFQPAIKDGQPVRYRKTVWLPATP
jgi:hypothetical protein